MTEETQVKIHYAEGSPWFWKIFGGAIMGIISILLLAHISNINSNIDRTFLDLRSENKELRLVLDTQKEKITNLELTKDRLQTLEKSLMSVQTSFEKVLSANAVFETRTTTVEKNIAELHECNKETIKLLNELKEKVVVTDAVKKATEPK